MSRDKKLPTTSNMTVFSFLLFIISSSTEGCFRIPKTSFFAYLIFWCMPQDIFTNITTIKILGLGVSMDCILFPWKMYSSRKPQYLWLWLCLEIKSVLIWVCMLSRFSRVWLSVTPWTVAHQAPLSIEFSRQEYWSGLPCLLQGIFPTQGSKPVFPHYRWILYHLSHQGSP